MTTGLGTVSSYIALNMNLNSSITPNVMNSVNLPPTDATPKDPKTWFDGQNDQNLCTIKVGPPEIDPKFTGHDTTKKVFRYTIQFHVKNAVVVGKYWKGKEKEFWLLLMKRITDAIFEKGSTISQKDEKARQLWEKRYKFFNGLQTLFKSYSQFVFVGSQVRGYFDLFGEENKDTVDTIFQLTGRDSKDINTVNRVLGSDLEIEKITTKELRSILLEKEKDTKEFSSTWLYAQPKTDFLQQSGIGEITDKTEKKIEEIKKEANDIYAKIKRVLNTTLKVGGVVAVAGVVVGAAYVGSLIFRNIRG